MATQPDNLIQAGNKIANNANVQGAGFKFQDGSGFDNTGKSFAAPTATPTPQVSIPKVIDSSMLGNSTPVSVPTQQPSAPTPTLNMADQILKQTQVEDTETQKLGTDLSTRIYDLLPKLAGETAALSEAQKAAGVDVKKQELLSLNSAILKKQAEIGQDDTKLVASMRAEETRDTLLPFAQSSQAKLAGDAAIIRALKTSEIGVLNAQVIAKQGDIALAIETAKDAVAVKYAPYKEAIAIYQAQLEALKPILSRDDARQLKAQELKTNLALKEVEKREKKESENLALAFTTGIKNKFVNKGGEMFRASDGKAYERPEDFFADAGVSSFEEAYARGLVGDLSAETIADRDFVMKLRDAYPDAGVSMTDTAEEAVAKLENSAKYLKETLIEDSGTSPNITKINGRDYIFDSETGQYVPAGQFIEGGEQSSPIEYVGNDGEELKLAPGQVETLSGYKNTLGSADTALSLLEGGVKTGPLEGRKLQAAKVTGGANEKQLELEQVLGKIKADFMKALSGAAVSDSEVERLSKFLPSITDQEAVIKSKLNTLKKETEQAQQNFLSTLGAKKNPDFKQTKTKAQLKSEFPQATDEEIEALYKEEVGFNSVGKTTASRGNTPYLKTLGAITGIDGSKYWKWGLDIDLKKGDPVRSPVSGEVIAVGINGGFGKQVKIRDTNGREWWLSHLDGTKVKKGQKIGAGTVIGLGGNSGKTYSPGGGDGSHLDITVRQNNKYLPARQVKSLLDKVMV